MLPLLLLLRTIWYALAVITQRSFHGLNCPNKKLNALWTEYVQQLIFRWYGSEHSN